MNDGQLLKEYLAINNIDISNLADKLNKSRAVIYTHFKKSSLKDSVKEMYTSHFGVNFFVDTNLERKELSQNSHKAKNVNQDVNYKNTSIGNINHKEFNDIGQVNTQLKYDENSTLLRKRLKAANNQTDNNWKALYFNSQEQVSLLYKQIELLNKIVMQR